MARVMRFVISVALAAGYLTTVSGPAAHAAALPTMTIGDVTVVEGDAGSAIIKVPVDLSAPSTVNVTVTYIVKSGTASAGADFLPRTGHLTFLAGPTVSKVVSVKVYGDVTSGEGDETVLVDLSAPVNATLANSEGVVTIADDDSDSNTGLQVSVGDFDVDEADAGAHYAYLPITLSQPAPTTIKVYYSVSCGGSAANGSDYVSKNKGTLTFLKGQQTKLLKFQIEANMQVETAKNILEKIAVALGPASVNDGTGDATIVDDDGTAPNDGLPVLPVWGLERQSVSSDGFGAASPAPGVCTSSSVGSSVPSVSANGRYVAFTSDAVGLVPDDTNGEWDVFVHDRLTGTTERVSVATDGTQPSGRAERGNISRDGRYVTFWEEGTLGGYPGHQWFIRDRQTHTTAPLLTDAARQLMNSSFIVQLSADDRYAAFSSCGDATGVLVPSDLDPPHPPDSGSACDAFVLDRTTGSYTLVSQPPDGSAGDGTAPTISADGRYVGFISGTSTLVPGDTNGCPDLFVRDMVTGTFERINVTTAGAQTIGCDAFQATGSLSDDGRYIAFSSDSWVLAGATSPLSPGTAHIYVRDRIAHTTTMVDAGGSQFALWPSISGDGAYVAYRCTRCGFDELVYLITEVATGDTIRASELPDGTQGDDTDYTYAPQLQSLTSDGRYAVFSTWATNLDNNDDNNAPDVFVKRIF